MVMRRLTLEGVSPAEAAKIALAAAVPDDAKSVEGDAGLADAEELQLAAGRISAPERLILGQPAADGALLVVGSTTPLSPAHRLEITGYLRSVTGSHPWPPDVSSRAGSWGSPSRRPVTRVEPTLVVEVETDSTYRYGKFRHLTRMLRLRPDLSARALSAPEPTAD
jgi:ATP-dependent DNA ligase